MKFPKSCEEFLTTFKGLKAAKGRVEGQKEGAQKSQSADEWFNYQEVLKSIGDYGNWQIRLFALLVLVRLQHFCYPKILPSMYNFSM